MTRYTQSGPREVVTARAETLGQRIGRVLLAVGLVCIALVIVGAVLAWLPALLALK